jgi:alanine dehydrogenase
LIKIFSFEPNLYRNKTNIMIIGCPKEIKIQEYRVGLTPEGVDALVRNGHTVYIETQAGAGSGFSDEAYKSVGAQILATAKEVFDIAEMIVKVKEPLAAEYGLIKSGQILFTYFHFAASKELTEAMMKTHAVCIA